LQHIHDGAVLKCNIPKSIIAAAASWAQNDPGVIEERESKADRGAEEMLRRWRGYIVL
jgi:hypothetical protein